MNNPESWQILESATLFKNAHLEVLREQVIPPGESKPRDWTVTRRKKAVVIAPRTSQGNYVLIHQARIPVRRLLWEFPAGQVDASMDPDLGLLEATAVRELEEETGYELEQGGSLTYLGHYYSSQGFTDETPHLFLANPVRLTGRGSMPDHSESIVECREFSFEQLRAMVADYVIQDANTLAIFARLTAKQLLP